MLAGGAVAFVLAHKPGDVSHPDVEFTSTTTTTTPPEAAGRRPFPVADVRLLGDRTRNFRDGRATSDRRFDAAGPAAAACCSSSRRDRRGSLYLLDDNGNLRAVEKTSGHVYWQQRLGRLAAASPAVGDGSVYAVALLGLASATGRVVAYRASDGRQVWSKALPSRTESSPLL